MIADLNYCVREKKLTHWKHTVLVVYASQHVVVLQVEPLLGSSLDLSATSRKVRLARLVGKSVQGGGRVGRRLNVL